MNAPATDKIFRSKTKFLLKSNLQRILNDFWTKKATAREKLIPLID